MARLASPRAKVRPRLEIIPFIDVMFFLLATFMMVSLSMIHNAGIDVNLPKMGTAKNMDKQPDELTISINQKGEIFEGRNTVTLEQLKSRLAGWKQAAPEGRIILQGDYGCDFGKVVEVMDAARALGLEKLVIRTDKPESRQP
ncbi:MAG: biopolymer transporter ExbD [Verrucomicrobiales bacterium]|jgi:biopolymer transport protein ExbD|nr:biopolymer transporter ExbD [Verrucomicrobiales bacterium]